MKKTIDEKKEDTRNFLYGLKGEGEFIMVNMGILNDWIKYVESYNIDSMKRANLISATHVVNKLLKQERQKAIEEFSDELRIKITDLFWCMGNRGTKEAKLSEEVILNEIEEVKLDKIEKVKKEMIEKK